MKIKAVTFSYDDGVLQDERLIELFNKYELKCTFNLNSGKLDKRRNLKKIYEGHEIALHGVCHLHLDSLNKEETEREIIDDAKNLGLLFDVEIEGASLAYGKANEYVNEAYKKAGIKYSRATEITQSFDIWHDIYRYRGTCRHSNENLFELAEKFIELKPQEPQIFYIWGHSYEFDREDGMWERIEDFFKIISRRNDILYGTNKEVFKYFKLI